MSVVFIIGAGASHGETLVPLPGGPPPICGANVPPPVTNGFFSGQLFENIRYSAEHAERDFEPAFKYVRWLKHLGDLAVGEGAWSSVDLEEIFTSVELSSLFQPPKSDAGAEYVLIRNSVIRYVWRIIAYCTLRKSGEYSKLLIRSLPQNGTIITFNYDLLLDQQQISQTADGNLYLDAQYERFQRLVLEGGDVAPEGGLFLKMHGSLNWFRCTNDRCPRAEAPEIDKDMQRCLNRALGIHTTDETCPRCGSDTIPLIVAPQPFKPVTEDAFLRNIWGLAKSKLSEADWVVLIGYSAPPADFYAAWLLRTTIGVRPNVHAIVVNPANAAGHPDHNEHQRRMASIFSAQFGTDRLDQRFRNFAQMEEVLSVLRNARQVLRANAASP